MKVNRSIARAAFMIFLASFHIPSLVTARISCGDEAILKLFSSYSSSQALQYIAYSHACREGMDRHHLIFYSCWFLKGDPKVAIQTTINEEGVAESVRSVFNWADQDARAYHLSDEQAASIAMTMDELPESAKSTPLAFLYVVSFKNHGKWITRVYDRRHLPAAITKLHSIIKDSVMSNGGA